MNFDFLIGKTKDKAIQSLQELDIPCGIIKEDTKAKIITRDHNSLRINLVIENNLVISYSKG